MPLQAKPSPFDASQKVIDLTLSDDDESPTTEQKLSNNLARASNLLQDVPPVHHGLPMFEPDTDHKPERRDGASGTNYTLQQSFKPLEHAAPTLTQPRSASRLAGPANSRKSNLIRPSASLEDLSNRRSLRNSSQNLANTPKRRKLNHNGMSLGGRGNSVTAARPGNIPSTTTILQRIEKPIGLTSSPTIAARTVITGESRSLSSYGLLQASGEGFVQESSPLGNKDNDSVVLLQIVLKLINVALKSHHTLSPTDRNTIAAKTAAYLIDPELKANYDNNQGQLSKQYERTIAREAKAYVDSYVETLKELKTKVIKSSKRVRGSFNVPSRYDGSDGSDESESSSSSSAAEGIFDQHSTFQHPGLDAVLLRSYSESPNTEPSNDPIDGASAQYLEASRKTSVRPIASNTTHSLRRSGRAATRTSQPSYIIGNKRRRRNPPSDNAGESPAGQEVETLPMDLDYEVENVVTERNPEADIQHVLEDMEDFVQPIQPTPKKAEMVPSENMMLSLLRQREMDGMAPVRVARGRTNLKATTYARLEDSFVQKSEWTDCSGDIASISWITEDAFLCGALAHLDSHNMQYNKPGNLLLGSTTQDTLKSFGDHRVARPVVDSSRNAENALPSMVATQDPWIYSSVVSTAHCKKSGYSFTASFDATVKIWSVSDDGSSMELAGTWRHDGKVNFVVTSDHHERVATASEVNSNAVRVYNFDDEAISKSAYDTYGGNKALGQTGEIHRSDTWSYQPATIQWGRASQVANLILVGYSPRSDTGDEVDIPDEKKNTGELCVFNAETGEPVTISSSHSQNVFEVQWHPTQPIFAAATSPSGAFDTEKTKTQIRLFALNESDIFMNIQALDCPALDINELTIMPNSEIQCYVTASCTDGSTYVYDTAQGDQAIHILQHGDSLETLAHDLPREIGDTGVTFAAWGKTTNRFYTGSSDGMVKAWNIKAPAGKAFVRNVLTLAGGIATGAFSKDFSKLIIGDATGKVYLMSVNDADLEGGPIATKVGKNSSAEIAQCTLKGTSRPSGVSIAGKFTLRGVPLQHALLPKNIRRPKLIIPHAEPPPPLGHEATQVKQETSMDIAQHYLYEGILEQHSGRGVYQGPNYAEGPSVDEKPWYRFEAHEDNDATKPLLPEFLAQQQYMTRQRNTELRLERLPRVKSSDPKKHEENTKLDLDFSQLSLELRKVLQDDKVEIEEDFIGPFKFDVVPRTKIFRRGKKKSKSEASRGETQERSMEDAEFMTA